MTCRCPVPIAGLNRRGPYCASRRSRRMLRLCGPIRRNSRRPQPMAQVVDAAAARISKFRAKNGLKSCSDREQVAAVVIVRTVAQRADWRCGRSGRRVMQSKPFCAQLNWDTKKVVHFRKTTARQPKVQHPSSNAGELANPPICWAPACIAMCNHNSPRAPTQEGRP